MPKDYAPLARCISLLGRARTAGNEPAIAKLAEAKNALLSAKEGCTASEQIGKRYLKEGEDLLLKGNSNAS